MSHHLFADGQVLENEEFLLALGLLIAVLLAGGITLVALDRWRKRQASATKRASVDALSTYRAMFDNGELTQEEYKVIRGRLARQMREELETPKSEKDLQGGPEKEPPV